MKLKQKIKMVATLVATLTGSAVYAGPFILSGTDADDHGGVSGSTNDTGWLYMQKVLENLAPAVTNGNTKVAVLGSTSTAAAAAHSAFGLSSLSGSGWTEVDIATSDFASFFNNTGSVKLSDFGIIMMDSGVNVSGGVDGSAFTPYANDINNFVGAGGGLFSQANGYQWLNALLPSVTVVDEFQTGIYLTPEGNAAFPSLTNADLSAGPYHNSFLGYSPIPVLGKSSVTNNVVIIGGAGGSITNPDPVSVSEPATLALLGLGLTAIFAARRKA